MTTSTMEGCSRLQPSLPASQLIALRSCSADFGVFALQDIPEDTIILEAKSPEVSAVMDNLRQKICDWCFEYNPEEDWVIGFESHPGLSFCCEDCKTLWHNKYNDEGLEAFTAAIKFLRSDKVKPRSDDDTSLATAEDMSEELFDKAWSVAEAQAELIYAYRCVSEDDKASLDSATARSQEEALENAFTLRVYDAEMMMMILNSLLSPISEWEKVKTLSTARSTRTVDVLTCGTRAFLHLHCILPVSVLKNGRLTRAAVERLISAKETNSFRIENDTPPQLGYALWVDASFFNHACRRNVYRIQDGRNYTFTTSRNVLKGEELTISYCPSFARDGTVLEERRKLLKELWGFECQCSQCLEEAGGDETEA